MIFIQAGNFSGCFQSPRYRLAEQARGPSAVIAGDIVKETCGIKPLFCWGD
jgi:hypothetical protein